MNKLTLLVGGLMLSTLALAQKPSADNPFSVEGQLGYSAATFNFQAPTVRVRYFLQDNLAARVTLGINNTKTTDVVYENADFSGGTGEVVNGSSNWQVGLGAEYHFEGTDRLSPYVGADILIGGGKTTGEGTNVDGSDNYSKGDSYTVSNPTSGMGLNLVAGTDYYFADNFYLGFELGLGFFSTKVKEGEYSSTVGGTTVSGKTNAESKGTAIVNNSIGLFRLGWRF